MSSLARLASAATGAAAPPRPRRGARAPPPPAPDPASASRRDALLRLGAATGAVLLSGAPAPARAFPLAPLGGVERVGGEKLRLPIADVAKTLERDLVDGQYFVTGDLTREIFDDRCRFVDPTNDVVGLSRYLAALALLFDPATSRVTLRNVEVTSPTTVETDGTLEGYLRFPWRPRVEPYAFHTVYTVDDASGLIVEQRQTWSISGARAIAETFTPNVSS